MDEEDYMLLKLKYMNLLKRYNDLLNLYFKIIDNISNGIYGN